MRLDEGGRPLEAAEGGAEGEVALVAGDEEGVVRGVLAGRLPDSLDGHVLRRVGRKAVKLDPVPISSEPDLSVGIEAMAGAVVDDEEDLAASMTTDELLEEGEEGLAVEHRREEIGEAGVVEGYGAIHVSGLPEPVGIDPRLDSDAGPGAVKAAVLPEAGLVLENYDSSTARRFFLIAGRRSRSHSACASASARAKRLRGRWIEKPRWWSSLGMCCL